MPFVAAFAVLRGLLMVPVGAMGPLWPGDSPSPAVGGGPVSKIESSARVCPACQGVSCW